MTSPLVACVPLLAKQASGKSSAACVPVHMAAAHSFMGAQELEFLHSMDESDDELPVPLVHRSFLQNICDAFVIAIQRCAADTPKDALPGYSCSPTTAQLVYGTVLTTSEGVRDLHMCCIDISTLVVLLFVPIVLHPCSPKLECRSLRTQAGGAVHSSRGDRFLTEEL